MIFPHPGKASKGNLLFVCLFVEEKRVCLEFRWLYGHTQHWSSRTLPFTILKTVYLLHVHTLPNYIYHLWILWTSCAVDKEKTMGGKKVMRVWSRNKHMPRLFTYPVIVKRISFFFPFALALFARGLYSYCSATSNSIDMKHLLTILSRMSKHYFSI